MRSFTQKSRAHIATAATWIEETTGAHPIAIGQLMFIAWMVIVAFGVGYSINSEANKKLEAEVEKIHSAKRYYLGFVEKVHEFKAINYDGKLSLVQMSNKLTHPIQSFIQFASQREQVSLLEVKALMSIESGFNCKKKPSTSDAVGCLQIIPSQHDIEDIKKNALICQTQFNQNIRLVWGKKRLLKNDCVNILTGVAFYRKLLDRYSNRYLAYLGYLLGAGGLDSVLRNTKDKDFLGMYSSAPSDLEVVLRLCKGKKYQEEHANDCANAKAEVKKVGKVRKNDFLYHILSYIAVARPDIDLLLAHNPNYPLEKVEALPPQPTTMQMLWTVIKKFFS